MFGGVVCRAEAMGHFLEPKYTDLNHDTIQDILLHVMSFTKSYSQAISRDPL